MIRFILAIFFFNYCNAQPSYTSKDIRISPENIEGISLFDAVDSIIFMPLEVVNHKPLSSIDKFDVIQDKFIAFDRSQMSIYIFSNKGKFIKQINYSSLPNNNKKNVLFDYSIDYYNRLIVLKSYDSVNAWRFSSFDVNGELKKDTVIISDQFKHLGRFIPLHDNQYLFERLPSAKKQSSLGYPLYSFYITDLYGKILKNLALTISNQALKLEDYVTGTNIFFFQPDSTILTVKPFELVLYQQSRDSFYASYNLIFPNKFVSPPIDINDIGKSGYLKDYFKTNKDFIYFIDFAYKIKNLILFKLFNYSGSLRKCMFFDLSTGESFVFKEGEKGAVISIIVKKLNNILSVDKDNIYISGTAIEFLTLNDINQNYKNKKINGLSNIHDKHNHVIIKLRLK